MCFDVGAAAAAAAADDVDNNGGGGGGDDDDVLVKVKNIPFHPSVRQLACRPACLPALCIP